MGAPRPWRCRNFGVCGVEEPPNVQRAIPQGWIGLMRYPGNKSTAPERLGLWHDIECLLDGVARLVRDGTFE